MRGPHRFAAGVASSVLNFSWTVLAEAPTVVLVTSPDILSSGARTPFFAFRADGASAWQ